MAVITGPNPAGTYHEGKGNRVLSITDILPLMVRYTDPDGKESLALIYAFGEADYGKSGKPEDRLMGLWVVANMSQLQDTLRMAPIETAKAIIAAMESKGLAQDGKLVGRAVMATVSLPDVSAIFENLEEEKPAAE